MVVVGATDIQGFELRKNCQIVVLSRQAASTGKPRVPARSAAETVLGRCSHGQKRVGECSVAIAEQHLAGVVELVADDDIQSLPSLLKSARPIEPGAKPVDACERQSVGCLKGAVAVAEQRVDIVHTRRRCWSRGLGRPRSDRALPSWFRSPRVAGARCSWSPWSWSRALAVKVPFARCRDRHAARR